MNNRIAEIRTSLGEVIQVPLLEDNEREQACLVIDGVPYHFERISRSELVGDYKVDADPDYNPKSDSDGFCYILAPYSA